MTPWQREFPSGLGKYLLKWMLIYACVGFGPLVIAMLAQLIYITGP